MPESERPRSFVMYLLGNPGPVLKIVGLPVINKYVEHYNTVIFQYTQER